MISRSWHVTRNWLPSAKNAQYRKIPRNQRFSINSNSFTGSYILNVFGLLITCFYTDFVIHSCQTTTHSQLEALGQCIPMPRHVLLVSRSGYGSVIRNPDTDLWFGSPPKFNNLFIGQPSVKISCKSVQKFLRKVANRQTDDDYISLLAEAISNWWVLLTS